MKPNTDREIDSSNESVQYLTDWFKVVAVVFAFLVLIGYALFIYHLARNVSNPEEAWSRLIFLFTGVEAIVFSAVGFIFGREVNRSRAESAEYTAKEANKEKKDAQKNELEALAKAKEEKLKGEHLAKEILNKAPSVPRSFGISGIRGLSAQVSKSDTGIFDLASTAKHFYPHLDEVQFFDKKGADFLKSELSSMSPRSPNKDEFLSEQAKGALEHFPKNPLDMGMSQKFKKPNNP